MATNEMDEYAQAHAANADEAEAAAGVELEANAEDAADNGQAAPAAEKNAGVSPKQKKMVLGGAAVGFVLLGALVVGNIMGGSGDGVAVAQYDQGNGANAFMDQGGVLANPSVQGPQGAAPLFDGQEPQTQLSINDLIAQGAVGQEPNQAPGVDAMAAPGAPVAPAAPAAFPAPTAPEAAPAVMAAAPVAVAPAITAGPAPSAAPAAPMLAAPAPVALMAAVPSVAPAVTASVATPAPAVETALSQQQIDEINKLRADNTTLRSQVADLKRQVDQIRKQVAVASKPASAPATAAAPAPSRPATATSSSRAADVASTTRAPQPQRNAGATKRGDFEIYAVTDGRVWVVGKDGERLGPLVVGSPLTDGSKITGIDVGRGVVLTSTGEIH